MGSGPNLTLIHKFVVLFFSASLVALSAHQLVKHSAKNKKGDIEARTKQLLEQLSGNIDVAKASISSEYFRESVDKQKLNPSLNGSENLQIRKSIKETVGSSVEKVIKTGEKK